MNIEDKAMPLQPKERLFVEFYVLYGDDKGLAYAKAFDGEDHYNEDTKASYNQKARERLKKPHIEEYRKELEREHIEDMRQRGIWTKTDSIRSLTKLVEAAERELFGDETIEPKQMTMGRVQGLMLPIKELNTMHGYNQSNHKIDIAPVQFTGVDKIPD